MIGIFSTPISIYNNKDIVEDIEKYILEKSNQQNTDIESKVAGHLKHRLKESAFNFLTENNKSITPLRNWIVDCLIDTVKKVYVDNKKKNYKVFFESSWYHVTEKYGYHEIHSHPNCSWCGIFYVSGDSGDTKFHSPIDSLYMDDGNSFIETMGVFKQSPEPGKLILFPSYLKHSVDEYTGNDKRITVAFNAQIYEKN